MLITNYKSHSKGALVAFFSVTTPAGMVLHGCKLFSKAAGNRWIGMPSEKFVDKSGVEGYRAIVEFSSREASESFGAAVLRALDAMQPQQQSQPTQPSQPQPSRPAQSRQPQSAQYRPSSGPVKAQIPAMPDDF